MDTKEFCPTCKGAWLIHEFAVPSPYCPDNEEIINDLHARLSAAEKERDEAKRLLRELFAADDAYGCGFYNDARWRNAYNDLRRLAEEQEGKNVSNP